MPTSRSWSVAVVPRPQSIGPSHKYIVRRVWVCAPFALTQPRFPLPPTVFVGDEEDNSFMEERYRTQITITGRGVG